MAELVCPTCKSGGRLYSTETTVIDFPGRITTDTAEAEAAGGFIDTSSVPAGPAVGVVYRDEEARPDYEGGTYEGNIWCRPCAIEWKVADLIPGGDDE